MGCLFLEVLYSSSINTSPSGLMLKFHKDLLSVGGFAFVVSAFPEAVS